MVKKRHANKNQKSKLVRKPIIQTVPKVEEINLTSLIKTKYFLFGSLGIIFLSFIIYYATSNYGYVLDDSIVITNNQFTKQGFLLIVGILDL